MAYLLPFRLVNRRRQWHPTPVLLPGKSHGWKSLVGCSPWGHEESDMTEWLHFHFYALEKEMATHSSVLAWRIPGMGSHRDGHNWSDLAAADLSTEKWCTTWELQVKFYWGQNKNCSLGDSTSDSLERLLQRDSGVRSIYKVLVKGMFNVIKFLLYKRFSASQEELMPPWRDLVLSRYEEMQGLGSWSQFLKISTCLKTCFPSFPGAQSALLSILDFLQGVSEVSSCSSTGRWQMPLLLLSHWQMLLASDNL